LYTCLPRRRFINNEREALPADTRPVQRSIVVSLRLFTVTLDNIALDRWGMLLKRREVVAREPRAAQTTKRETERERERGGEGGGRLQIKFAPCNCAHLRRIGSGTKIDKQAIAQIDLIVSRRIGCARYTRARAFPLVTRASILRFHFSRIQAVAATRAQSAARSPDSRVTQSGSVLMNENSHTALSDKG